MFISMQIRKIFLIFFKSGIDNPEYPCILQDIKQWRFELGNRFKASFFIFKHSENTMAIRKENKS